MEALRLTCCVHALASGSSVSHTLAFALNGVDLGVAFTDLPTCVPVPMIMLPCGCLMLCELVSVRSDGLIPAVCMGATGSGVGVAAHQLMIIRTKHEYDSMVAELRGDSEAKLDNEDESLVEVPPQGVWPLGVRPWVQPTMPIPSRLMLACTEHFMFSTVERNVNAEVTSGRTVVRHGAWGSAMLQYPIMKPGSGVHVFRFKVLKVRTPVMSPARRSAHIRFPSLRVSCWSSWLR